MIINDLVKHVLLRSQMSCNSVCCIYYLNVPIREHFQGRNEKGKTNNTSADEKYNELIGVLREKTNILAEKVYEHGFLL